MINNLRPLHGVSRYQDARSVPRAYSSKIPSDVNHAKHYTDDIIHIVFSFSQAAVFLYRCISSLLCVLIYLLLCVQGKEKPGNDLLSHVERSTIGVGGLNFRVRNGNGWNPSTMVTRQNMRCQGSPEVSRHSPWGDCRNIWSSRTVD